MLKGRMAPPLLLHVIRQKDVVAGAIFVVFGVAGTLLTRDLTIGTAAVVGSGFMPRLISVLLIVFGTWVLINGLRSTDDPVQIGPFKPLLLVTSCVMVFAASLETFGLIVAILLTVGLSGFASRKPRWMTILVVGTTLAAVCVLVFIWGAKLPIKMGPF